MNPTGTLFNLDEDVVRFIGANYDQLQEYPLELLPWWPGQWVISQSRKNEVVYAQGLYVRSIIFKGSAFRIYIPSNSKR